MCLTVWQRFDGCDCTISRNLICTDHINHTRKQTDNIPCPKLQVRYVEMADGACGKDDECKERRGEVWVFDHFEQHQGDFTFLEDAAPYRELPRCLGKGHFTKTHKCGVGKTVDGFWRHLDKGGFPIATTVNRAKKTKIKIEEKEDIEGKEEKVFIKQEDVDMDG